MQTTATATAATAAAAADDDDATQLNTPFFSHPWSRHSPCFSEIIAVVDR